MLILLAISLLVPKIYNWYNSYANPNIIYCYYDLSLIRNDTAKPYTIHGLWPEGCQKHQWPEFCNNSDKFNLTKIASLVDEMRQIWISYEPSYPGHDTISFWEHEWSKHGTCTGMGQFEYFNRTINLYKYSYDEGLVDNLCWQKATECKIPFNLNFTRRL